MGECQKPKDLVTYDAGLVKGECMCVAARSIVVGVDADK